MCLWVCSHIAHMCGWQRTERGSSQARFILFEVGSLIDVELDTYAGPAVLELPGTHLCLPAVSPQLGLR